MTLQERIRKLSQASRLIGEVKDSLSVEKKNCDCCGLVTYTNWEQYCNRQVLNGVLNKLEKSVERMERNPEQYGE